MTLDTTDLDRLRSRLIELTREAEPAVVAVDRLGLIVLVDPPIARALGWRSEDLVRQPLTMLIPKRLRDAHHLGFSRFLTTREPMILERPVSLGISMRSGEELRAQHVITALRTGRGWMFGAAIQMEGSRVG